MSALALRTGLASALLIAAASSQAASVAVDILDSAGKPLADAAIYAEPESGAPASKSAKTVEIEQKGRKFLPAVTVIQTGTNISFPNNDTVRHHVYSFSPAKVFELKLYSGEPANPVHFDKPGTVVIGCNIHDQMAAYIHVVPTPYFAKSDAAGKAKLDGLPPGKYRLKAWHFGLPAGVPVAEQPLVVSGADSTTTINLNVKARSN
ncbi:MAG TPA: methylamine utilization protein [Noviherbaspirillum sp.]|nr:methylamine utilization protein [Noviherbaspirillum sp.]